MAFLVPLGVPTMPRPEPLYVGRPPRSRSAQELQAVLNHCEAWRFRGWCRTIIEVDASACPAVLSGADSTPRWAPGPHTSTVVARHVHPLRANARNMWVGVQYQADSETSGSPRIDVQLYTLGGILLDRGVRFEASAGTMETARKWNQALWVASGMTKAWVYPHLWLHTGVRIDDDARTAGTPGAPRLLSLAGTSPRSRVEVRVTSTNARVLAICSWEWPEGTL